MGIFPSWLNITPVSYPILIHPDSPISDILYLDEPPIVYDCSYEPEDNTIVIDTVTEVTYG